MQRKALGALTVAAGLLVATFGARAEGVEGKLVLYTSQPNTDAQQTIDAFKAKYPKVDISFVRDGTPPSWPSSGRNSRLARRRPTCC